MSGCEHREFSQLLHLNTLSSFALFHLSSLFLLIHVPLSSPDRGFRHHQVQHWSLCLGILYSKRQRPQSTANSQLHRPQLLIPRPRSLPHQHNLTSSVILIKFKGYVVSNFKSSCQNFYDPSTRAATVTKKSDGKYPVFLCITTLQPKVAYCQCTWLRLLLDCRATNSPPSKSQSRSGLWGEV